MYIFSHPKWLDKCFVPYKTIREVPEQFFEEINKRLDAVISTSPVVTVVIPAYNEEMNILGCINSLSRAKTKVPFNVIVVDNNSTDATAEVLRKLHIISLSETRKGPGPARQLGQEKAEGKYIFTADGDCFYPPTWIDEMYRAIRPEGVSCIYGRFSFIESDTTPRWKLFVYESLRNMMAEVRHINRPHLNSFMLNMGYVKSLGLEIGFDLRNVRGEDGRMCFDLGQRGKVVQVRSVRARPWTWQRTINQDGSLNQSLLKRVLKEVKKVGQYIRPLPPHDTKSSQND